MILSNFTRVATISIVFFALECAILGSQPNLVLNSDIETGSPANWGTAVSSGTMDLTWSTSQKVSGTHSLCTVVSDAGQGQWQQLITGITANTHYRFRVHIRASNVTTESHSAELQWFAADDTYLGRHCFSATTIDEWQELKNNDITPPANAVKVVVLMRTYSVGTYYFDDPVLTRKDNDLYTLDGAFPIGLYALPSNELIINGNVDGHATNSTEIPQTWETCNGGGTPTFLWDSTLKYSGTRSLKITLPGTGNVDWRQLISNINVNDSFRLKAQIYATNVTTESHGVELQWFDANSTYLGRNVFCAGSSGQWNSIDQSNITPPAGAVKVYLLLRAYKTGSYNFDDLAFTREPTDAQIVQELKDAGFNLYLNCLLDPMATAGGIYAGWNVDMTNTTALTDTINLIENKPALRIWVGNDEPAYPLAPPAISADDMITGYDTIVSEDDYRTGTPHLVWINHAPLGTYDYPSDFSLLRPYSAAADIISMDIYPVGGANHSILADKTLSCVGAYTQVLYNEVCTDDTGLQDKAIWMVLQGFSWTDLDNSFTHAVEIHWLGSSGLLRRDCFYTTSTNTWDSITANNLVPPVGATSAAILLRTYSEGSYYFDNVYFKKAGTNVISNSTFETGLSGYPRYWTRIVSSGTTVQTWDTSTYVSYRHSAKSSVTDSGQAEWRQVVSVDASKIYSLSASVKSSVGAALPSPNWVQTRFMAYDAIINGARGLMYWGTCLLRANNVEIWGNVKQIAGEISDLSPELTSPLSFRNVSATSSSIEYLLLDTSTGLCLIAANKTASAVSSVTFTISGLPLSQIEEYNAASPENITNNSFTKNFAAYEVKIYSITHE